MIITPKMVRMPRAKPGSRWTLAWEAFASQFLLVCGSTNEAVAWLRLDWRAVDRIMARGVERGLARRELERMPYLGMEHARLLAHGDTTLKGTRYDWLFQPDKLSDDRLLSFKESVESDLTTSKDWNRKTLFSEFLNQTCVNTAKQFFDQWFKRAVSSKIKPVVAVAQTLQRRLIGLLAYIKHRITNALVESLNSRIQTLETMLAAFIALIP